ncbi:MAG: ABC transporter ATP-binding protein [Spirochaetes bacterium]|nr:ABC transporter ATP-binding protein [Spirochaetota bacterium]
MPGIKLRNIKNFICKDINLEVRDKEFLVLWGPTGTGKSTLLNIIAGYIEYKGSVLLDDIAIDNLPVYQRKIGYLFQNLILFPHLDVRANIAYGLNIQKKPKHEIKLKVDELLRLMRVEHIAHRFPKNLSGGEKQRVALARIFALCPKVMLLDEPLNSLDFKTARILRNAIKKFQKKFGITTIYVTHCFEEAFALADRVAVLNNGSIVQIDLPENIFKETDCRMVEEEGHCDCHQGENKNSLQIEHDKMFLCHQCN